MKVMTAYTPDQAHAAAARGAAWLDEKCPGWEERIDLAILDLADSQLCVLGQTANCICGALTPSDVANQRLGFWRVFTAEGWTQGWEPTFLGFDRANGAASWDEGNAQYEMLTIAWREIIRARLESAQ